MINLDDGLDLDEVLQIARWMKVAEKLKPELHDRLSRGANAGIRLMAHLQEPAFAWLLPILPLDIRDDLNNGSDALQVIKELLDA